MNKTLLRVAGFILVVGLIAVLALVTQYEEDPCANPQGDVSAAVLGEDPDDQAGLINRAILMRGHCEEEADDQ